MKGKRRLMFIAMAACLIGLLLPGGALAVNVFTECAYKNGVDPNFGDVVCQVFVDTDGTSADGLRSVGVRLTYNASDLASTGGTINTGDWFFGADTSDYPTPNSFDNSIPGIIDIVAGKLNTNDTSAGVIGSRVKVADLTFDRITSNDVDISASSARGGGSFVGVVDADGSQPVEGYEIKVAERCDTNGNGSLSTTDLTILRAMLRANFADFPVYADCTGDGKLSTVDVTVLRAKLRNP